MFAVESLKEYLAMETDSTSGITVAVHYLNDVSFLKGKAWTALIDRQYYSDLPVKQAR